MVKQTKLAHTFNVKINAHNSFKKERKRKTKDEDLISVMEN